MTDVIENPVTGERVRFLPSDGRRLRFEAMMRPGGFAPFLHVHLNQEERFTVLAGHPRFQVGRETRDAQPGDELVVPPGTPHVLYNPTDEEVVLTTEFEPPMRTEEMFRVFFALAQVGKLSRRAVPHNPLLAARFAYEYRNEARVTGFPLGWLHRLSPLGAGLARLFGFSLPTPAA